MADENNAADSWIKGTGNLVEAYRNLLILKVVEYTSTGASLSIVGFLTLIIGLFLLLFAGLGAAWWLGENLNNMKAGFFIVGGVYAVIFVFLILASRKLLIPRIRNRIIKEMYEQD